VRSKVRGWWENDAFQLDFLNEVLSFLFCFSWNFFIFSSSRKRSSREKEKKIPPQQNGSREGGWGRAGRNYQNNSSRCHRCLENIG
jgi:hypothetical protein